LLSLYTLFRDPQGGEGLN